MFPLRKNYVRRLLREVGFQRIDTYGDFQASYSDGDPDFFIHVAEKTYHKDDELNEMYSLAVKTARDYYNSEDADAFYSSIWGGEDIHIGIYTDTDDIAAASRRTVELMVGKVEITAGTRVLDVGSGYGGAARYLARTFGCAVTCLNLSEVENDRNRRLTAEQGLEHLITVTDGSFEDLPFQDNRFDLVWSQDAILHSGDRPRVLQEMVRVLAPGGELIFTDPMASDDCAKQALRPILQRLHLDTMGSPSFYRTTLARLGVRAIEFDDLSAHLPHHYRRVLEETERAESQAPARISADYLGPMKAGLQHWVDGGDAGRLAWGIFHGRT
jgi:sarcosine/dimethylglycine N-methyltransferase